MEDCMLETGSLIEGKYRILSTIGRGGMSQVYLAINDKANKTWAVKEVRKDGGNSREIERQGLIAETELLKKLNHPNLPSIVDVIDTKDSFIIVMDYIEGNTLQYLLDREGAQDQDLVIKWSKQLCDVLRYLHSRKPPIIYRDLKPANVMLRPDGNITLIDFGTAREYKYSCEEDTHWMGTRGYAAPEQFGGHGQTDGRTDIFNLGATMYHLVTGLSPADTNYEFLPVGNIVPCVKGSGLEKVIACACRPDPSQRYQDCDELMYALENVHAEDDAEKAKRRQRLSRFLAALFSSLFFLLAGVCFHIAFTHSQGEMYRKYLSGAASEPVFSEKVKYYKSAISLIPGRPDAYREMIGNAEMLPELSEDVYKLILDCINSTEGDPHHRRFNIDILSKRDSMACADFYLRLGVLVYLYYPGGKANAVEFLKRAVDSGGLRGQKLGEARLLLELSEAYRKRIRNDGKTRRGQITESSDYREYWDRLGDMTKELGRLQDITGDVGYPIRVCDEAANEVNSPRICNYNEQGVTEENMRRILRRAELFIDSAVGSTPFYRAEIARVRSNLARAEEALDDYFHSLPQNGAGSL